jgi:hypothetical protein
MITESIGTCPNQSIGAMPNTRASQEKNPDTGFIKSSSRPARDGGHDEEGARSPSGDDALAIDRLVKQERQQDPEHDGDHQHRPDKDKVFQNRGGEGGVGDEIGVGWLGR